MNKRKTQDKCYNCGNFGIVTREHIIPKFFLDKSEEGFFIYCCEDCRAKLKWLDDYAADYFKFLNSSNSFKDYEIWYKQVLLQNGSPFSLMLIGKDVVINEDLLMRFIHKVCVGITYKLFGLLDNSYRINIITNFSKLGSFSEYNDTKSFTEKDTQKILNSRNRFLSYFEQFLNPYYKKIYKINNANIKYTGNKLINGAIWFTVELYGKYKIICAIANGLSPQLSNARNMIFASFPLNVDILELEQRHEEIRQSKHGEKILTNYSYSPISNESRALRKTELQSLGVSSSDIGTFEKSLADNMLYNGGRERLENMFREYLKGNIKFK
jgi:hypothetical protein